MKRSQWQRELKGIELQVVAYKLQSAERREL